MLKRQTAYRSLIIVVGFLIIGYCAAYVMKQVQGSGFTVQDAVNWAIVLLLFALSRSLPVYISEDKSIDVSFVPVVASMMVFGLHTTIVLFSFSILFFFLMDEDTKKLRYALKASPGNEIFNLCNIILSDFVGGQMLLLLGGTGSDFRFPYSILPAILFALISICLNLIFFIFDFVSAGKEKFAPMFYQNILGILPNVFSTIPFGILLAILLNMQNGAYFVLLFMFPLLLARYSFKLYLDSKSMYMRTISSLSMAIDAKDRYTQGHSQRVAAYSQQLATAMGLHRDMVENVKVAAILHDIGKIGVRNDVLNKPARLTEEEFEEIKMHPVIGRKIIDDIRLSPVINEAVLYHHCHYNGGGYPPNGPKFENFPVAAAILGVADAFDAMTTDRPYRKGMTKEAATEEIHRFSGTQFDPKVVTAFDSIVDKIEL
ncbi:HD-GYP domain-containing protein [Papillibacter cinnamivorans]|uniref:HDIG domain-containing protein n=1 Tax=Papillibacter cinnamivorans DSM 12816 TaxID=1122930 RepID=A0A1W2A182_9FIRM|nr:HD-GYP domain-containing protein [Papillibacter cinnamivorans]SMC54181.1 HDIG domain-containing protein [Papillibacter cinnamivorans DSM 12816]